VNKQAVGYLRTLVFAAVLGLPVAIAAVLFQTAIHDVIHFVWEVVPDWMGDSEPAGWYVIGVTALTGVVVAVLLRLPGHGGHPPLEGISVGDVRPIELPGILLAGLATLGGGIVLGPEAPLIALGLGLGGIAVRLVRVEQTEAQLLIVAGAFAAIAVLFGGPLAASLMLLELIVSSGRVPPKKIVPALLPGFVAAGTGALVFTGVNDWQGIHETSLSLPNLPPYDTVRFADLAWCVLLALVIAAVVVGFRHLAHEMNARTVPRPGLTLVAAGAAVGVLAVAFRAIADRPVDLVLFSGQAEMPLVVAEGTAWVLLLLVAAKGLAYAVSLGAGFRGGPVFPALAIGVALGVMGADVLPGLSLTPAVATGLAAGTAAVLRTPFTAVLLSTLLVGSSAPDVAPITVLAAATGWLAATAFPAPEDRRPASGEPLDPPVGDEDAADHDHDQ
jgi:chloride channel protein, CIC family